MPARYLAFHRPICSVIEQIRELARQRNDDATIKLCDEAENYAKRMSAKLSEYKDKQTKET